VVAPLNGSTSMRNRGERFSKRPSATNALVRERLLLVEGIVVESVKQKFNYAGEKQFSPDGGNSPFRNEEFVVNGRYNQMLGSVK